MPDDDSFMSLLRIVKEINGTEEGTIQLRLRMYAMCGGE